MGGKFKQIKPAEMKNKFSMIVSAIKNILRSESSNVSSKDEHTNGATGTCIDGHLDGHLSGAARKFIAEHAGTIENNPYLQSRALWLDIYGDAEERYKKSRKLNQWFLVMIAACIIGMIYIGSQSKFIPYVVEIQNGQVIYTSAAQSSDFSSIRPKLTNYFIQQFIKSARSVSVDGYIEKNDQKKAFALTSGASTNALSEFFKERDPYQVVEKRTISVEVNYINQLPNDAVQVGWEEISRDSQTGQQLGTEQYVGEFNFKWDTPSQSEYILQNNPFGFYITNISWTGVKQ